MPKDNKQQSRTQSRRAASKEALKQMHILLGDERQLEISSEDDDVIEVEVQPPKKKYKLTHRKSSDGNDRDVIVLKTVNHSDESIFDLEVVVEDLNASQKSRRELLLKEEKEIEAKIEQLRQASKSEVIYNGVCSTALEITEQLQSVLQGTGTQFTLQNQSNTLGTTGGVQQPVAGQSIMLQQQPASGNNAMPQSYQLVMDPRLGVIVGAVSTPNASPNTPPLQLYQPKVTIPTTASITSTPEAPMKTRRGTILRQVPSSALPPLHKTTMASQKTPAMTTTTPVKTTPAKGLQVKSTLKTIGPKAGAQKPVAQPKPIMPMKSRPQPTTTNTPTTTFRPTESNVEGGLSMGGKAPKSIDLTSEDGRAVPDSREVSFNKLQGRTYPSLVVVARPHLRVKDLAADRAKLDIKVKSVLMYPPTKFTEWLIQQGLVRSDQKCSVHPNNALKLGMYSDASKFPYSGGYVWISECCPQRFVSVFSGSLFEGSTHPPMAILKLLYHWCCQTIVQNVTQWVKVDNLYVKGMYTWLRSICTVALHTHIKQLGGPGVKVQVGVISLGTTSQDGNKREVKVEVLGILETTTRHIRLRAVEPLADGERNYKKRFSKILEPVFNWVHPSSIIVTDLTVDKATLHQMGFLHVAQSTSTDYAQSNRTIMEYLRRIVPRMFQNTLSLLSRQIIQQFLDELVWREWYGTTVMQCFDNMVQHLSEQTRHDAGQSLIVRLNKVSSNPFKNWSITVGTIGTSAKTTTEQPTPKRYSRQRKPATPQPREVESRESREPRVTVTQDVVRPTKSTSPDVPEQMVPLENYYYGTINPFSNAKNKVTINIKCPFCKLTFNTNITLMNHLFKHAHNVSNDVQLCKYCLTIVPSGNDLLKHIGSSHPDETKFDNSFVCLICESHFRNPFILGKHMSKEHCPSELPYVCGTCSFRCSNHKQAVDHFYQQHDHGTTIQCPFCLKSTTIFTGGRNITQNMNYFIQHLQKHQKKHLAKRCGRCTLWFIQKEFLKDHQTKMHISQRGKHGLVPCFAPRNGVMVPKSRMDKCPDDAKVINFSTLYFNVGKNLNCKECNKPLNTPKHFASFESCQNPNCQFSTCCSSSMQEHVSNCKSLNSKLPAEKLPYEMFCVCGYSDIYGNMMAKHLAICERKSAYPSIEAAKQATVTHSMLDVLGLVRKPDESTSSKQPQKHAQPNILKPRGRPRKHVDNEPIVVRAVIDLDDDDEVENSETNISISDVQGGVESVEVTNETTEKEKEKVEEDKSPEDKESGDGETIGNDEGQEKSKDSTVEEQAKEGEEDKTAEKLEEATSDENKEEKEAEKIEENESEEKEDGEKEGKADETIEEKTDKAEEMIDETIEEKTDETIEEKTDETVEEKGDETTMEEKVDETIEEEKTDETIEEEKDEKMEAETDETTEDNNVSETIEEEDGDKKQDTMEEETKETDEQEEKQDDKIHDDSEQQEKEMVTEKIGDDLTAETTSNEQNEETHEIVESEAMEVDSCNNSEEEVNKEGATVAIENKLENDEAIKDDENINKEVCPMDTD